MEEKKKKMQRLGEDDDDQQPKRFLKSIPPRFPHTEKLEKTK